MQDFNDPKLYGYRHNGTLICKECADQDPFKMAHKQGIRIYGADAAGVQCKVCGKFLKSTICNYTIDTTHPIRRRTVCIAVQV